ncbi:TonB-dependent receptor [Sphingobium sp. EM0848]|uniref:TonB-dependent receptor n=1 Tax=Sphingobium sp. EM0848 TaxID=2743473 RepID=UPI00159C60B7|nr:TonB-dependent receptor [Sphingobium sp. EM0848]
MNRFPRKESVYRLSASCLALAMMTLSSGAFAQQNGAASDWTGNEIIVTATKRNESIQNVPFSINAQTAEAMQRMGATSIEDVSRSVAGLTVQNLGPGQSQVSVRGVSAGQVVRDQPGVKEQVGVYLDESVISMSLFTPDFDLFDLDRVETLRGPQGTLFGSGSEGGTVRYITKQPKLGQTEGTVEGGVNVLKGGDVGYSGKGAINLPLGDNAAIRAVGYGEHYAGFIDAIGPAAGKNINDGRRYGGRLSLLWEPAPGIKLTPRIIYQDIKTNGFNREDSYHLYYNELISPFDILPERTQYLKLREEFRDKTTLADFTGSVDLGSDITLTSITTYIHRDILVSRDASALTGSVSVTPFVTQLGVNPAIANLPSNLRDTTKLKQWTQELRLASTGSGPFQWVIGGFYSHVDRDYKQRLPTPGYDAFIDAALGAGKSAAAANGFPLNSPYNADIPYIIKQYAAFGEASYKLGQFKLTAGGRYYDFKEERDFKTGGVFPNGDNRVGDKTSSNGFSPRFIASFEANHDLTFNVQASKGFRLGGVNDPLNLPLCSGGATGPDAATYGNRPTFDDETLWNYEAGVKASGGGVTFNAAVFHNDIKNLQVTADAGSCSSRVIFNVPKAHTTGVEAELSTRLSPNLDLSLSGSYIDSKIDSNVTDASGAIIAGIRKGNRLPTVPKFQMAAAATYTMQIAAETDWSFTASYQHVGNRYTQLGDQEAGAGSFTNSIYYNPATGAYGTGAFNFGSYKLGAYNLVNLSTGVNWDSGLSITLYVNNLFDENALYSLDRERGGRGRLGYNIGTPRKIGVTVRKDF